MSNINVSIGIDISRKHLGRLRSALGPGPPLRQYRRRDCRAAGLAGGTRSPTGSCASRQVDASSLVVGSLQKAGLPVALVNARQIRDFARPPGIFAKTDRLDARVLAEYGEAIHPPVTAAHPCARSWPCTSPGNARSSIYTSGAPSIAHAAPSDAIKADIAEHIGQMETRLDACERHIRALIAADAALARKQAVLYQLQGHRRDDRRHPAGRASRAGRRHSAPEVAALAGLAPFNHDSGSLRGTRHIRGGHDDIRTASTWLPSPP